LYVALSSYINICYFDFLDQFLLFIILKNKVMGKKSKIIQRMIKINKKKEKATYI
jgi:hypothetical protein